MPANEMVYSADIATANQQDQLQTTTDSQPTAERSQNPITNSPIQFEQPAFEQNGPALVAPWARDDDLVNIDTEMIRPAQDVLTNRYENPIHSIDNHIDDYVSTLSENIQSIIMNQAMNGGEYPSATGATVTVTGGSVVIQTPCKNGGYFSELHNHGGHPELPSGVHGALKTADGAWVDFGASDDPQSDFGGILEDCKNGTSESMTKGSSSTDNESGGGEKGIFDALYDFFFGSNDEGTSKITAETDITLGMAGGMIPSEMNHIGMVGESAMMDLVNMNQINSQNHASLIDSFVF